MSKALVNLSTVMKPQKPYADSTLQNMNKSELINYVRVLEKNYDVAIGFLNQQAENVKDWTPVVCAHWMFESGYFECSNCGGLALNCNASQLQVLSDYCPHCGAKMDEDKEELNTNEPWKESVMQHFTRRK